jgi:hypothetical protein
VKARLNAAPCSLLVLYSLRLAVLNFSAATYVLRIAAVRTCDARAKCTLMCLYVNRQEHIDSAVTGASVPTTTTDAVQSPPSKRRKELHASAVAAKQLGKSLSVSKHTTQLLRYRDWFDSCNSHTTTVVLHAHISLG